MPCAARLTAAATAAAAGPGFVPAPHCRLLHPPGGWTAATLTGAAMQGRLTDAALVASLSRSLVFTVKSLTVRSSTPLSLVLPSLAYEWLSVPQGAPFGEGARPIRSRPRNLSHALSQFRVATSFRFSI